MSKEKETEITCKTCGKKIKTTGTGDFTTFVCDECQERVNLPAYKAELAEYEGLELSNRQVGRVSFLEAKIKEIEEGIESEKEAE